MTSSVTSKFHRFFKHLCTREEDLDAFFRSIRRNKQYIADGRLGTIFKATVTLEDGEELEIAYKVVDGYKHPELEEELNLEVKAYKKLEELQDVCIPKLFVDEPIDYFVSAFKATT